MTPVQFYAVAQSIRSRDPVRSAARLVLVDGMQQSEAVAQTGISKQRISNSVARIKAAHLLMVNAYLGTKP